MTERPETSANPPSYPSGGSYGQLLEWHLRYWGTYPGCSTTERNDPWNLSDFAKRVHEKGVDPDSALKNLRNWRKDGHPPKEDYRAQRIEEELFGDDANLIGWRDDMRAEADRHRGFAPSKGAGAIGRGDNVPPPTAHFTGRGDEVETIVEALLLPNPRPVLVQGGPGIGKSTLTQMVAHDPRIAERFGKAKRWFVELETASTAEDMQRAIAMALGCALTLDFNAVLDELRAAPGLLILDNLETPWEPATTGGRNDTESILARLAGIPGLGVLASFRGIDSVGGLPWMVHRLEPLVAPFDRDLFCRVAVREDRDDPYLDRLVDALGGIPLAIELTARQACDGVPLAEVWRQWEAVGTQLARHPDFEEGRLTSLPVSIELSLKSPRLTLDAFALFRLLGQLPSGLATPDRDAIIRSGGYEAAQSLSRTGLAFRRADRIDLLPPIRDHAARHHRPTDANNAAWSLHYTHLARDTVGGAFSLGGDELRNRVIPEIANIEAALRYATQHPQLLPSAVSAAAEFRRLMTMVGVGSIATLLAIVDACAVAGDSFNEGKVCVQIGIIAQERGDMALAWAILDRGLAAFQRSSNANDVTIGKGDCVYRQADIHLHSSRLNEARSMYVDAQKYYAAAQHHRGEGDSAYRLADIEWRRGNFAEALGRIEGALHSFRAANFHVGEANSAWLRARITLDSGDADGAEPLFADASAIYSGIGYNLGIAHCRKGVGDIALARRQFDVAETCYQDARKIYDSVADEKGVGTCDLGLAHVAHGRGDASLARNLCTKALALFVKAEVTDYIGHSHAALALLTDGVERREHARIARSKFLEAGVTYLAERVAAEFGGD